MRTFVALAAFILIGACTPSPAPTPEPAPAPAAEAQPVQSSEQTACAEKGGEWRPICRMQTPACVTTFPDADKACADGVDCAGDCLTHAADGPIPAGKITTGVCAANDDPCGCKQKVEGGKATPAICVD
jgi:hypothetical protein